jgi:hypothetical protein
MDRRAETDSCEERRDQLGAGVREANAEIQSRSYCVRFECPDDIDRLVLHRGVDFFKVRLAPSRLIMQSLFDPLLWAITCL